jgi:hypothetical protein
MKTGDVLFPRFVPILRLKAKTSNDLVGAILKPDERLVVKFSVKRKSGEGYLLTFIGREKTIYESVYFREELKKSESSLK